jgi:hypothetical protein
MAAWRSSAIGEQRLTTYAVPWVTPRVRSVGFHRALRDFVTPECAADMLYA